MTRSSQATVLPGEENGQDKNTRETGQDIAPVGDPDQDQLDNLSDVVSDTVDTEGPAGGKTPHSAQVTAWLFREGADPTHVDLEDVAELSADDASFVWLDLEGFDREVLEAVADRIDLPAAGVRLALAGWQRPRLSVFGDRYVAAVTVPHGDVGEYHILASELDVFVGRNYLVSVHKRPLPFGDRVLSRASQHPSLLALDSGFLVTILVDELLAEYELLTEGLEDEVQALEERALTDASDEFLEDLLRLKRFVFATYRLAGQHRPLLEAFLRPDFPLVGEEEIEPYFRDLEVRLERLMDALGTTRESVNGTFDLYVSRVSHQTNAVMKVLTVASVTLLPATVILSFYGTSFEHPSLTSLGGFIAMVVLIVVTTVCSLVLFWRWGWLGEKQGTPATSSGAEYGRSRLDARRRDDRSDRPDG